MKNDYICKHNDRLFRLLIAIGLCLTDEQRRAPSPMKKLKKQWKPNKTNNL